MTMQDKSLRKGRFSDESGKRDKCQQPVHHQSMTMEKSWVMMMHQTDKEHEE